MTAKSFLIDTHVFVWWISERERIAPTIRAIIADTSNSIYVSAAATWEIAIKTRIGKMNVKEDTVQYIADSFFIPLPITHAHASATADLPPIHGDPFDRIQLAQAKCEGLTFITGDTINLSYPHIAMLAAV